MLVTRFHPDPRFVEMIDEATPLPDAEPKWTHHAPGKGESTTTDSAKKVLLPPLKAAEKAGEGLGVMFAILIHVRGMGHPGVALGRLVGK